MPDYYKRNLTRLVGLVPFINVLKMIRRFVEIKIKTKTTFLVLEKSWDQDRGLKITSPVQRDSLLDVTQRCAALSAASADILAYFLCCVFVELTKMQQNIQQRFAAAASQQRSQAVHVRLIGPVFPQQINLSLI